MRDEMREERRREDIQEIGVSALKSSAQST